MRASRAEVLLAAGWLVLAGIAPAAAQIGPPIRLTPPPPPDSTGAAGPDAPSREASGPDGRTEGISAQPLAPIDPSWTGSLGAADHAFPSTMWAETPRRLVAAALLLLQPTTSPTLQSLSHRLLLSDAAPPAGDDPAGGPSLVALRLDRLLALGRSDGASLLTSLPTNLVDEAVDRDAFELKLAAGDQTGACGLVREQIARDHEAWWSRALVACQALKGEYDKAALGLSALREQKVLRDPGFEVLIEATLGHPQSVDKVAHPTPLTLALLGAAKLPLPTDALATASPAALAVYASSDKAPVDQRLPAGERAAAFGVLPPEGLGLLYASVAASAEERAAAAKPGTLPDTPRRRAILYNLARSSEPGPQRIAALTPLLAEARRRGAVIPSARLIAPLVAELQPLPESRGFAADAARVLLAAHQFDEARPWIALAAQPELNYVAALAGVFTSGGESPGLTPALAALKARDAAAAPRRAALLLGLANALGQPPEDGDDLAAFLQPPHQGVLPDGTVWYDQQQAAAAERLGETVLMTLLLAQVGDGLSPEPIVLAQAIIGLMAVGLDEDARSLALEAALNAGI